MITRARRASTLRSPASALYSASGIYRRAWLPGESLRSVATPPPGVRKTAPCPGAERAPEERPDHEQEEQREGQPEDVSVAQDDRRDQRKRQERERQPGPAASSSHSIRLSAGKVRDELVELRVGLGGETAFEALLELVAVEAARDVVLAENLGDCIAFAVADAEAAVAGTPTVVRVLMLCGHRRPFCRVRSRGQASGSLSASRE